MIVDHVTICGPDLDTLQTALAAFGLQPQYGGAHANGVTHMALLGFADGSYLELIAPLKPGQTGGAHWGALMKERAGCCAWAVRVENIGAEVSRLRSLGIEVNGPIPGSRKRPDGKILEWEIAVPGPGEPGALLPFMIQDHTPRQWRVPPSPKITNGGLTGIAAVLLAVKDIRMAGELFRQAYGWKMPPIAADPEFGEIMYFPGTPVILASPVHADSWLARRLQKFGNRPAAFLLGSRDLHAAGTRFHLSTSEKRFGREISWFPEEQSSALRLGVAAL